MTLSAKDQTKPFILIGATIVGVFLQRVIGHGLPLLIGVTQTGVFVVILAVMLPVELTDVGAAMMKVKPTALALFVNFIFIPSFSWSLGWLVLRDYPDFWVGAILYTLTPCIGWYLIFIDIAKGNVAWGIALLPWNMTLQVLLLPAYLYLLIGKVIPIDAWSLLRSVGLFFMAPFLLSFVVRKTIIAVRGREYFFERFMTTIDKVKLWTFVAVIISMFLSQETLTFSDISAVALLVSFLTGFFVVLFALAVLLARAFKLSYEDNTTLAFTTTARNSEAVIGVALTAFPGHPLIYFAMILGPVIELPLLLLIARVMLRLRHWVTCSTDPSASSSNIGPQLPSG